MVVPVSILGDGVSNASRPPITNSAEGELHLAVLENSPRSGCGYKLIGIYIEQQNAPPPSPDRLLSYVVGTMNIQEMARLMAQQERLLRQMQPALETAHQLWRQVQPAVDLVRQHEENFRRIAAVSEAAADARRVAGLEEVLAGRHTALSRHVERLTQAELARLEEVAATVRRSMPTVPSLAPEMLGDAWNDRLADAVAHLRERAERLAGAPDVGKPEDVKSLAGDIEAVTAVTPAEGRENISRWLVLVLFFVFDALALDPAKEVLRDAVAKLLVILLVTAAEATVPNPPPLPPASAVPETGTEAIEDASEDASETTRRAISELRRIGGLTWAELGQLFGVSPQSIHSWASGGTLDAITEQHLLQVVDIVRGADRGDAQSNRMALFEMDGETPFELLASRKFEEARAILGSGPGRRRPKLTELDDATKAERRPPPPEELIDALKDSVHRDLGSGRAACTARNRRRGLVG